MEIHPREIKSYEYDLINIGDVQLMHNAICHYQSHIFRKMTELRTDCSDYEFFSKQLTTLEEWSGVLYDFFKGEG